MKILVLVTDAFGGQGGIAKFNRDFLTALCRYPDSERVVVLPRVISEEIGKLPERLHYVATAAEGKCRYLFELLKICFCHKKFDLIICGHINLLPLAYVARFRHRKASQICIIYGVDAWLPHKNSLTRFLARRIKRFISISEFTKAKFLGWSNLKEFQSFILPCCVDFEKFCPGPRSERLLEKYNLHQKILLMTLARISAVERYKGFDQVLEVLPVLTNDIPNLVYMIVGDGDDRLRLEQKVTSLNLINNVIFTGYIPETEKPDYLRLADVYVMPGWGEGFGIVYLEAMACGIPVVASKLDGSQAAVRAGELGICVDPHDPENLKRGILKALKERKGERSKGLEYFSSKNFEIRLHQILKKLTRPM